MFEKKEFCKAYNWLVARITLAKARAFKINNIMAVNLMLSKENCNRAGVKYSSALAIKKIYAAIGLLLVTCLLMITVVLSLHERQQATPQEPASLTNNLGASEAQRTNSILTQPIEKVIITHDDTETMVTTPEKSEDKATKYPVKGNIKLDFGWQVQPVYNDWRYHTGIDIQSEFGENVKAVFSGKVIERYTDTRNGLTVVVKNDAYTIYYSSLSVVNVTKGSYIKSGEIIGRVGQNDTEPYPHLHLAVKKGDEYLDPKIIVANE